MSHFSESFQSLHVTQPLQSFQRQSFQTLVRLQPGPLWHPGCSMLAESGSAPLRVFFPLIMRYPLTFCGHLGTNNTSSPRPRIPRMHGPRVQDAHILGTLRRPTHTHTPHPSLTPWTAAAPASGVTVVDHMRTHPECLPWALVAAGHSGVALEGGYACQRLTPSPRSQLQTPDPPCCTSISRCLSVPLARLKRPCACLLCATRSLLGTAATPSQEGSLSNLLSLAAKQIDV